MPTDGTRTSGYRRGDSVTGIQNVGVSLPWKVTIAVVLDIRADADPGDRDVPAAIERKHHTRGLIVWE